MTNIEEGTWVPAKHADIREGDLVRITEKDGPKTSVTEGEVTSYDQHGFRNSEAVWSVADYENFYAYEFETNGFDDEVPTLEKFVPKFVWPSKVGAVVKLKDENGEYTAVLVYAAQGSAEDDVWYTIEWGLTDVGDLGEFTDLTIISEGVTV